MPEAFDSEFRRIVRMVFEFIQPTVLPVLLHRNFGGYIKNS